MQIFVADTVLMPYAVDTWSTDDIHVARQARGGLELAATFPCEALDLSSRVPLRLNNTRFDLDGMPDLADSGGSEAVFIRDLVKRQCKPWEAGGHRFIDSYFAALDGILKEHAGELSDKLAPFHGLYDPAHWLFSAPRPFPRAHLFAPSASASPALTADDFVVVDFAFFLGPQQVAMLSVQSGLTPKKARERQERLERAGVRVVSFTPSDLTDRAADLFTRALAPRLPRFWDGDPLPMGPFRPTAIEE